jgi:hypothetical protein
MSIGYRVYDLTGYTASEDMSKAGTLTGNDGAGNACGQYLFVKLGATLDQASHCTADNDRPIGISQNNPKSGDGLAIRALGVSKITAGVGGLAIGDQVGTDTAGRGIKKTVNATGADMGDWVLGECRKAALVGELADIEMTGRYQIAL